MLPSEGSGGALCIPSGIGLPSRDKLSGVNVPLKPRWLGEAGADLEQI